MFSSELLISCCFKWWHPWTKSYSIIYIYRYIYSIKSIKVLYTCNCKTVSTVMVARLRTLLTIEKRDSTSNFSISEGAWVVKIWVKISADNVGSKLRLPALGWPEETNAILLAMLLCYTKQDGSEALWFKAQKCGKRKWLVCSCNLQGTSIYRP